MAMNFKVLENEQVVAEYAADILRKQFNNNPTTIAGVHLSSDNAPVLDELKKNVDKHAVDFSQINILDYDNNKSYFEALDVPEGQIFNVSFGEDTESFIKDKLYEENGKTSFEPSDLKAHRMVNVILDEAAAEGLPEDVRHYFTARFA